MSGIEARGELSEVGVRQRAQQAARGYERQGLVLDAREVGREEVAAERSAARERRELARELVGDAREVVLERVALDRREQLERVSAQSERRIERRQGLFGPLREKFLEQARALRERLGRELTRVKEWVHEHFPGPTVKLDLEALKARGRAAAQGWREALHDRQAQAQARERESPNASRRKGVPGARSRARDEALRLRRSERGMARDAGGSARADRSLQRARAREAVGGAASSGCARRRRCASSGDKWSCDRRRSGNSIGVWSAEP